MQKISMICVARVQVVDNFGLVPVLERRESEKNAGGSKKAKGVGCDVL